MDDLTRRDFLRLLGATGISALSANTLLSGCGDQTPSSQTPVEETAKLQPTSTPVESISDTSVPDIAVVRNGDPEEMVRRALLALGGIERFVSAGDNVIIKPNICHSYHSYEYATTTNPWVVSALVKLCNEAGAKRVRVMDSPFGGSAEQAYVRTGIQEQVNAAGGDMVPMSALGFVETDIPEGVDLKRWKIYDDILKADVVINVPIAKHHNLAGLTLGMKNLMGVISNRSALHRNLGQRLADITSRVRPTLTIVDAVRILTAHGPTGGNLDDVKKMDTIIASTDIVAADSYAATLFDLKPTDLAYVRAGTAMGLGQSDLDSLRIAEINIGA